MAHNKRELGAEELFEFIKSITKYVNKEIKIYALGGTALTILNIKNSTLDIDVNIESEKEYKYICKIFDDLGFQRKGRRWYTQEGLAFDMFHGSHILGTELLPEAITEAELIKEIGKIKLYVIPLEDIIISKLARGDKRDFQDIKSILEYKDINLREFTKRYKRTMKQSTVKNYKQKLLDLIDIKFKEWNIRISEELLKEVKEWKK